MLQLWLAALGVATPSPARELFGAPAFGPAIGTAARVRAQEVMEMMLKHGGNVDSPDKVLLPPCPPISTAPADWRLLVREPA